MSQSTAAGEHPYVTRVRETFEGYEAGTVPTSEFLAFIAELRSDVQASMRKPVDDLITVQMARELDQLAATIASAG